jgi:hypothetical protein
MLCVFWDAVDGKDTKANWIKMQTLFGYCLSLKSVIYLKCLLGILGGLSTPRCAKLRGCFADDG